MYNLSFQGYPSAVYYYSILLFLPGGNGFQMSFGIGAFPFGFFATNFNLGENHSGHTHVHGMRGHGTGAPEGTAQYAEEQFLHKVKCILQSQYFSFRISDLTFIEIIEYVLLFYS